MAIGTFGGVVAFVDHSVGADGLFRIIVVPGPEDKWPEERYIRHGTKVNGWIQLNQVSLGYELWRQFNAFPPSMNTAPSSLEDSGFSVPE